MANRRFEMHHYRQALMRMRQGESDRRIAEDKLMGRPRAASLRRLAVVRGWLEPGTALPDDAALAADVEASKTARKRAAQGSSLEPHRALVTAWIAAGVEATAMHQKLARDHAFTGHYSSVRRFVRQLAGSVPRVTTVLDFAPGDTAQVDFGSGPVLIDGRTGKPSKTWVFVMTLAWSRHQYAELVTDQSIETWLGCHRRSFEHFGRVPARVLIDNLKAAIVRACYHDPDVQRSYADCASDYGFVIAPCPVRDPQKKGIVESGVKYVKRNFLSLLEAKDIADANRQLATWVMDVAGQRKHGTTHERPIERFESIERALMKPLPAVAPECAFWRQAKLHPDCHLQVDKVRYSAPWRLVGKTLDVRVSESTVRIYHEHEQKAVHARGAGPGARRTLDEHLPPDAVAYKQRDPVWCREKAARIGPHCLAVVERHLANPVLEKLRTVQGIVGLAKRFGPARLDAACRRALFFDNVNYRPIKTILENELDRVADPEGALETLPDAYTGGGAFARDTDTLFTSH